LDGRNPRQAYRDFFGSGSFFGEELVKSRPFSADLLALKTDGVPLWDGRSEKIVREAFENEADYWHISRKCAEIDGAIFAHDDEDDWVVFLVPVEDPTDSPEDNDEE